MITRLGNLLKLFAALKISKRMIGAALIFGTLIAGFIRLNQAGQLTDFLQFMCGFLTGVIVFGIPLVGLILIFGREQSQ